MTFSSQSQRASAAGSLPEIRIWRSPRSRFGIHGLMAAPDADLEDETFTADTAYTDAELARIAGEGFNGIWLSGVLRQVVSVEPFPELGRNADRHQQSLRSLIGRAERHGIKVWLYLQPPRAVPAEWTDFWERHPEAGGEEAPMQVHDDEPSLLFRSLCTSTEKVKQWLVNASAELAEKLPGLAGVILITASEFNSHCYTHRTRFTPTEWCPKISCPRCAERDPEEVAAEVVERVSRGIASRSPSMKVVAWNWSWSWREDSNERVISRLPKETVVMADFERGGVRDVPGRKAFLYDEYSLSYAGPSARFLRCGKAARECGLAMMAKLQLGTTHELATVASLPMVGNLYDKARYQVEKGLAGFMGCWNFGNYPSANTAAFHAFLQADPAAGKLAALEAFAASYFPGCSPELVRRAWELFETAMIWYPFTIAFLYHGAHSHTLAYGEIYRAAPLSGRPAGRSWQPDERGDDLSNSYRLHHTQYDLDDIIGRFEKLGGIWAYGVEILREGLSGAESEHARLEMGNAAICGAVWQSTANTYKAYRLRQNWTSGAAFALAEIAAGEIEILKSALPWIEADERQGIHLEPLARMFGADSITHKLHVLNELIQDPQKSGRAAPDVSPAQEAACLSAAT